MHSNHCQEARHNQEKRTEALSMAARGNGHGSPCRLRRTNVTKCSGKILQIPKSSLNDRVKGKVKVDAKPGVSTKLSNEDENALVKYLQLCGRMGFPKSPLQVRNKARELALKRGMQEEIAAKSFTHGWYMKFMHRHKDQLSVRRLQALEVSRAAVTKSNVTSLHDALEEVKRDYPIL